jgi:hemerythrin
MMTAHHRRRQFTWNDGFLLGHEPMDEIHEEFVTLVRGLMEAQDRDVPGALQAVAGHVHRHFEAENAWMVETAFPARQCHIDEHAAVTRSIECVVERARQGDLEAARRLGRALIDWFPGHADYLDAALAHWLCKRRLGGKPIVVRRRIESFDPASR